jgi:hypothetical protein
MALDVDINGNGYSLREDRDHSKVVTRPVQQFVQPIRQTGRTRPEDLAPYESFIVPNLMYGFGRYRVNSDVAFDPKEYRRFWDSTCETRWADAIYLPILPEDTTQTNCDVIRASTNFKGETNALWDDLVSAGVHHVVNRQFTGASDTWENGGTINPLLQGTQNFHLTNGSSVTTSISFPAGANKALIVVLNGIGGNSASISDPSAMAYAGDALTKLGGSTGTLYSSIWYLANPDSGTNNLVTTWAMTSANRDGFGSAMLFHGVDQSTPMSSGATATGTATSATTTVTTAAGDYVISSINFLTDGTITIPDTHETLYTGEGQEDDSDVSGKFAMTYKIATDTSTAMDFTFAASESFEHTTGIVNPASSPSIGIDLIQHKTNLVAMTCAEDDHLVYTSTDGATWTASTTPITVGLLADSVTANENIDAGLFATIGGELVAAVWDEDGGTITFFSSTNAGVVWADETVDIASSNGPQGLAVYPDIDGENKLYLGTNEGIYLIDTAPSTWTYELIMPLNNHNDNGRRMTVHQGALWFAQGVDNSTPAPIYKMTVSGNARQIEPDYGLSFGDGVPDNLLGSVKWMKSSGDLLFIAVGGGAASRNGRILCWNSSGWHSMVKDTTANQRMQWCEVGSGDDGVPRLHYGFRTATTTSDVKFLEQPLVNPRAGVTIKRDDLSGSNVGHIELPYFDMGMPHENKNFAAVHISAEDLDTTSDEYVEVEYGLNGAATTTDLGNYTSSTSKNLFGSGAGVSGKNIGLRLKVNRGGTNTNTPKIRDIVVEGFVVPSILYEHQMQVDIEQTAAETGLSVENVISNLETLISSVPQVTFKFGQVSKYVAVDRERSSFSYNINSWEASGAPNSMADRSGIFTLTLIEKATS